MVRKKSQLWTILARRIFSLAVWPGAFAFLTRFALPAAPPLAVPAAECMWCSLPFSSEQSSLSARISFAKVAAERTAAAAAVDAGCLRCRGCLYGLASDPTGCYKPIPPKKVFFLKKKKKTNKQRRKLKTKGKNTRKMRGKPEGSRPCGCWLNRPKTTAWAAAAVPAVVPAGRRSLAA